jgi:acetyl esterase/lipase
MTAARSPELTTSRSWTLGIAASFVCLFGELWLPNVTPTATVVIVHGGFRRARYDLSLGRPLAADLARRGYAAWNLEYRRVGAGGGWPTTFEDIAAGTDLLAELPVDTTSVAVIGHSAGGHLAARAGRAGLPSGAPGARPLVPVSAVISQAGVLTLADSACTPGPTKRCPSPIASAA